MNKYESKAFPEKTVATWRSILLSSWKVSGLEQPQQGAAH